MRGLVRLTRYTLWRITAIIIKDLITLILLLLVVVYFFRLYSQSQCSKSAIQILLNSAAKVAERVKA